MVKKTSKSKNFHLISPQEQLRYDFFKSYDFNLSLSRMVNNNVISEVSGVEGVKFNEFDRSFKLTKGKTWLNLLLRSKNKKSS
jgi:hypothetical protein